MVSALFLVHSLGVDVQHSVATAAKYLSVLHIQAKANEEPSKTLAILTALVIFALEMMAITFSTGVTCSFGFYRSKSHQQFPSDCIQALSCLSC